MGAAVTKLATFSAACDQAPAEATNEATQNLAYERHAPAVLRRLWQMCGDRHLAEDLTQETFITAFRRWQHCRDEAARVAWLNGIAYNLLRDARKTKRRRGQLQSERCHGRLALPAQGEGPPDGQADAFTLAAQLVNLLDAMDAKLRDVFVLRVIEGQSLAEVAKFLGMSTSTVSERAIAAEKQIRRALGDS